MSFSQADYSAAQVMLEKAYQVYNSLEDKFLAYSTLFERNYIQLIEYINYFRALILLKTGEFSKFGREGVLTKMQTKIVDGKVIFNIQYKNPHILEHHYTVDLNPLSDSWEQLSNQFKSLKVNDNNMADIQLRGEAANLFNFVTEFMNLLVLIIHEDTQPKSDVEKLINQASNNFNTVVTLLDELLQKNILDGWWYAEFAYFLYTLTDWAELFLVDKSHKKFLNNVKSKSEELQKKSDILSISSRGILIRQIIENRWQWPVTWPLPKKTK